jgi:two-component system NtrC family sensor kinase
MGRDNREPARKAIVLKPSLAGQEYFPQAGLGLLLSLLDDLGLGAVVADARGIVVKANETFGRLVGRGAAEVAGGSLGEYLKENLVKEIVEEVECGKGRSGCSAGRGVEVELTAGERGAVLAEMRICQAGSPGEEALVCFRDLTRERTRERDEEKQKLRQIHFLRNIIHTSQEGIVASDMKGNIILFNEGAEKLLGWKAEEVIGKVDVTALYPPGVAQEIMRKLRSPDYGGVGRLQAQHFIGVHKEGERIPVSLSASIIYEEGKEAASVGIFTDLRERTRLQKKLEEMKLQVFQIEKMASLGKLAAGVAHEINNPLAGILLFSHILKKKVGGEGEVSSDTDRIISDATRCKEIVQALLDFAHQTEQRKSMVDINRTVESGLTLLGKQAMFQNIEVVRELDPSLPPILANPTQLSQVLINLVTNAIDAMPRGGVLAVRTGPAGEGDYVRFEVSDTGCGISPDNLQKIFDPFFTTKAVGKGTGLGLSVVYGIVEDHEGRIGVSSSPGTGTTFTIDLPAHRRREKQP